MEPVSINTIGLNEISVNKFDLLLLVKFSSRINKYNMLMERYYNHILNLLPDIPNQKKIARGYLNSYLRKNTHFKNVIIIVPNRNYIINRVNLSNLGYDNVIQISYAYTYSLFDTNTILVTNPRINRIVRRYSLESRINSNFTTAYYMMSVNLTDRENAVEIDQVFNLKRNIFKKIDLVQDIFLDDQGNFKKYKTSTAKLVSIADNFVINMDYYMSETACANQTKMIESYDFSKLEIISQLAMAINNDYCASYEDIYNDKLLLFLPYYHYVSKTVYMKKFNSYFTIYNRAINMCYYFNDACINNKKLIINILMNETPLRFFIIAGKYHHVHDKYYEFISTNCKNNNGDPDYSDTERMINVIKLNNLMYYNYKCYNDKLMTLIYAKTDIKSTLISILEYVFANRSEFEEYIY